MPRDGSGVYSAPAGTTATAGTTIESAKYNAFINDLVTDANTARPVVAGGTGATTAAAALTNLGLTATAAELNVLDGIPGTLTATEIGYLDGVTSAIQTQLDGKASFTIGASQAASGSATDFTGIPATVNVITLTFSQVSLSGTDNLDIRLGNSGGFISSGYVAPYGHAIAGTTITAATGTTGMPLRLGVAGEGLSGIATIRRFASGSNRWIMTFHGTRATVGGAATASVVAGAELDVGAALTQVRVRPFGTDTFDNGNIAISWS